MRVLVIDDDPHIRAALRRLLVAKYRAEVAEASDGVSGLQCLLGDPYDLVLLDLHMRAMDGMETLRAIRRSPRHGSMPVMMLTGDSDESVVADAKALGVGAFLVKPVDATILFERIDAALSSANDEDQQEGGADLTVPDDPDVLTVATVPALSPKAPIKRVLAECVKLRY